jgi:hypothetical protein
MINVLRDFILARNTRARYLSQPRYSFGYQNTKSMSTYLIAELLRLKVGLATKLISRLLLVRECRKRELDQHSVFEWVYAKVMNLMDR